MEWSVMLIVTLVCLVLLSPVLLFRPLVLAIANRIAGKQVNTDEVKMLKTRVALLEEQVHELRTRVISVEDGHEFARKMLDDRAGKT